MTESVITGTWSKEDEKYMQKMLAATDEHAVEWAQRKMKEIMTLMTYYKCAMMEIETKLNVLNEAYSIEHDRNPINSIKTRLKRPQSIKGKMEQRQIPITPESIEDSLNDIAGVRVICSFPEDVYAVAEALLKQDDVTLIKKKDYIANPKPNGYRSLHLIVSIPIFLANDKRMIKVEIQLRTIAMDFWASLEHQLHYKKNVDFTEDMASELYDCARISSDLDLRMEKLRSRVYYQAGENDKNKQYTGE